MKSFLTVLFIFSFLIGCSNEPEPITKLDTNSQLTELLLEFLDGATHNDYHIHNNFWANELIYTGSAGSRITKSDILSGLDPNSRNNEPEIIYTGDQIQILDYGNIAIVAFRLLATNLADTSISYFYNTGTFRLKDDKWQAVAWQATRIPDENF